MCRPVDKIASIAELKDAIRALFLEYRDECLENLGAFDPKWFGVLTFPAKAAGVRLYWMDAINTQRHLHARLIGNLAGGGIESSIADILQFLNALRLEFAQAQAEDRKAA